MPIIHKRKLAGSKANDDGQNWEIRCKYFLLLNFHYDSFLTHIMQDFLIRSNNMFHIYEFKSKMSISNDDFEEYAESFKKNLNDDFMDSWDLKYFIEVNGKDNVERSEIPNYFINDNRISRKQLSFYPWDKKSLDLYKHNSTGSIIRKAKIWQEKNITKECIECYSTISISRVLDMFLELNKKDIIKETKKEGFIDLSWNELMNLFTSEYSSDNVTNQILRFSFNNGSIESIVRDKFLEFASEKDMNLISLSFFNDRKSIEEAIDDQTLTKIREKVNKSLKANIYIEKQIENNQELIDYLVSLNN